jgi:zinc/manganese transport system ATP-binding protein
MVPDKTSQTLVQATNLSAGYGTKAIWQDANFTIRRGEFVGLLGPNGAGKTTLFRLLLGLALPTSGKLHIFGTVPRRGNSRIGYVPQRHPIDSELRIEALEMVRLGISGTRWGLTSSSQDEQTQALQALQLVGGEALAHRALGELSGGELQRIFLAQALVSKPDLLLLDEPLANLDIRRETELVQLVSRIAHSEHVAVLLIAHDINPLLPVVDRIIYIVNGKVANGLVQEIVTSKQLSALYGAPVEVLHDSRGRVAVLGTEEAVHHE